MRVLHWFADYRWTGPAEPVARLVVRLRERGVDARFACASRHRVWDQESYVVQGARELGIEPVPGFSLMRYFRPREWLSDLRSLGDYLKREKIDILHTHLDHDHHLGALGARLCRADVRVVRTNHRARPMRPSRLLPKGLFLQFTDAYVGFSRAAAESDQRTFRIPDDRVFLVDPAIDLDRFNAEGDRDRVRRDLGVGPEHVLGAIVARVQTHRRWDLVVDAVEKAHAARPHIRLMVLGRGEGLDAMLRPMIRERGLESVILTPGYRGDDFVDYLAATDYALYIKPGADGTCRAVGQAMAMGKPIVTTNIGMLPELVPHRRAGLIAEPTAESLAGVLIEIAGDATLRASLGECALSEARRRFDERAQAEAVASMYERVAAMPPARRRLSRA